METMYDRLGDLLNETLTEGKVNKKYQKASLSDSDREKSEREDKKEKGTFFNKKDEKKEGKESSKREKTSESEKKISYISPQIIRACRLLDITVSATQEDIKKAYKEKIKYYHPDKYEKNPVLRSVANKKTRMIVEAYDLLLKSFV